ncbi:hypothetical protein Tco_0445101 [Tanacetum coccineum]
MAYGSFTLPEMLPGGDCANMGTTRLRWGSKSLRGITRLVYHDLYLGGKTLVERENVGFDLTKSDLCPSLIKDLIEKGVGLRVANSQTGNHREDDFTPLETIQRFLEGGAGNEGSSPSTKSVNNEAPVIDVEPLTVVHPSEFAENIGDSDDDLSEKDEVTLIDRNIVEKAQNQKVSASSKAAGKRKLTAEYVDSDPDSHEFPSAKELKDSAYCHWVVAHVTPPSWKQHLKEISLKKLCDIHDNAYMASCDAIREKEIKKHKVYAELERKYNDALQDLDKNPLLLDMRVEIETLRGKVDMLHGKYSRLVLEEKKWINYEQTLAILHSKDKAAVMAKVVPHVATELVRSDEMGLLFSWLVKAAMFHGRCTTFEEVADLKEPFDLEKMPGYHHSFKKLRIEFRPSWR